MSSQNTEGTQTPTSAGHSSSTLSGNRRWGPRMACWVTDPTKPMAFIDRNGKTLIICRPRYPSKARDGFPPIVSSGSSTTNTSPRASLPKLATAFDDSEPSDISSQELIQNNLGCPQNLMLSGLADGTFGNNHLCNGHSSGLPEMLCFNNLAVDRDDQEDGDNQDDGDDEGNGDEFEYINFCDDEEEKEELIDQPLPVAAAASHSSQGKTQTPGSNDYSAENLLNHLDTGVVTAFRRSQHHETIAHQLQDSLLARSDLTSKASGHFASSNSLSSVRRRGFE